ncbi:MAG: C25 family cysteine peptidase [Phycisphaerae bacterium]
MDVQSCRIYATTKGYDYLMVGDLLPEACPGQPLLAMKTFRVELDRETEILGLEVVEGTFREIKVELKLIPANRVAAPNLFEVIADDKVYSLDALFPGCLVKFDQGVDDQHRYIFVHLFPVQYTPAKKKAMLLTKATIKLSYRLRNPADALGQLAPSRRMQNDQGRGLATEAQCIVLCPATLQQEAQKLSQFHVAQEGITSTVVTTEAIGQAYTPAEDPPLEGYQNAQLDGWDRIRHYDYALAKKIVAYLRDQPAHPRLVYVTVLGDGLLIPPSFYYYFPPFATREPPIPSREWVPTDLFYASPDYDWVCNYRIGRISVNDANEAAQVVDKVIRWYADADWSWFRNIQFSGGMEMEGQAALAQKEGLLEGLNVKRYFSYDDRSERVFLEPALTARDAGIFLCGSHGSVSSLGFSASLSFSSDDLLHYAPRIKVPVIVSFGCMAGAFDLDLMEGLRTRSTHSFGEAVLKSPGAGIAYLGNTREGLGGSLTWVSSGGSEPMDWKAYTARLVTGTIRSRRRGADTLGRLYADALFDFLSTADMAGNPWNVLSVLEFILLGDPALKIPAQP